MQLDRKNKIVEQQVCSRLRLGGRWYYPGDRIQLDEADAEVYRMRGFVKHPKPADDDTATKTLHPQQVGIQVKNGEAEGQQIVATPQQPVVKQSKPEESQHGRHSRDSRKGR